MDETPKNPFKLDGLILFVPSIAKIVVPVHYLPEHAMWWCKVLSGQGITEPSVRPETDPSTFGTVRHHSSALIELSTAALMQGKALKLQDM